MPALTRLERWQPLWILCAAAGGLLASASPGAARLAEPMVLPLLLLLLTVAFLDLPFKDLLHGVRAVRVTGADVALNFLWTPVFAWGLTALALPDRPDLALGLFILLITPCTDWYLAFTAIARGNVALSTALLPWHLGLQLLLLPAYVLLFFGGEMSIDAGRLISGVLLIAGLPLLVAAALRRACGTRRVREALSRHSGPAQTIILALAIAAMFTAHGAVLGEDFGAFTRLVPPLLAFFAVTFVLAWVAGRGLGLAGDARISLIFASLARNSPLALAVAVAAFPDRPMIALALVVGPLVELPVLSGLAWLLGRRAL